jgi:hypothetical protein
MPYLNIYYIGIIGIPGKGPNYRETYNPNKTIGDIIEILKNNGFGENNRKIVVLKPIPGTLDKFEDINNPYWSNETILSEYFNYYGGVKGNDCMLIYALV